MAGNITQGSQVGSGGFSASYQIAVPQQLQGISTILSSINTNIENQSLPQTGAFTMTNTASLVINNTKVLASSIIFLTPVNNSAATLQGSVLHLYPLANANFMTVKTASGGAAAGTEKFNYLII